LIERTIRLPETDYTPGPLRVEFNTLLKRAIGYLHFVKAKDLAN